MAKWQFRKFKKFGPFRINFTKRGVSASTGIPGFRLSANSQGRSASHHWRCGLRTLQTGEDLSRPKPTAEPWAQGRTRSHRRDQGSRRPQGWRGPGSRGTRHSRTRQGGRALPDSPSSAGLSPEDPVTARRALLVPDGDKTQILLIVEPSENPSLFKPQGNQKPVPPRPFPRAG